MEALWYWLSSVKELIPVLTPFEVTALLTFGVLVGVLIAKHASLRKMDWVIRLMHESELVGAVAVQKPPGVLERVGLRLAAPLVSRNVAVLFATDRSALTGKDKYSTQFTNERGELRFGAAQVSVPFNHKMGQVERPSWRRLQFSLNPKKHMMLLKSVLCHETRIFFDLVQIYLGNKTPRCAFIFVHGYNVTFEDAALRTAQMAVDLDLNAVPVFYSWPSQGGLAKYIIDESNVEWTEPHLLSFFEQFADHSGVDEVYVIAHSMGSRATTRALATLMLRRNDLRVRFRELVLAAPDIDATVFKRDIAPALNAMHQRMTLYASSKDKALALSRKVHGYPRAGESGSAIVVVPGVETIDASHIDTDFFGHSYVVEARPLLTDLALLLKGNMRASQRPTLDVNDSENARYWFFRP